MFVTAGSMGEDMQAQQFFDELQRRISKYDLLCHPFYQAWSAGTLTQEDLRNYSAQYYHHVAAFPTYLSAFHSRLNDGALRRAVLRNLAEEEIEGPVHSELWLDFAEAYSNDRAAVKKQEPNAAIRELIAFFLRTAREAAPAAALAAFYAYESQVPRVAEFKEKGLRKFYGAGDKASRYFWLHKTVDLQHSSVWREQLKYTLAQDPESADEALRAAEHAAQALWKALDAIEGERKSRAAAA